MPKTRLWSLLTSFELQVGDLVHGVVMSLQAQNAYICLEGGSTGKLHISNISNRRVLDIKEVFSIGDKLKVG